MFKDRELVKKPYFIISNSRYLGLGTPKVPVITSPAPLTIQQLETILNSSKTTDAHKQLVRKAVLKRERASKRSGISLNRLFPIIDFETGDISFWFD